MSGSNNEVRYETEEKDDDTVVVVVVAEEIPHVDVGILLLGRDAKDREEKAEQL